MLAILTRFISYAIDQFPARVFFRLILHVRNQFVQLASSLVYLFYFFFKISDMSLTADSKSVLSAIKASEPSLAIIGFPRNIIQNKRGVLARLECHGELDGMSDAAFSDRSSDDGDGLGP